MAEDEVKAASQTKAPLWQRLLGVRRREGRFVPIRLTRLGWFWSVVVLFLAGSAAFAEYSMTPDFCRSCHIMEPYYQAWHDSTHRDVPCADCHFEPGLAGTLEGKWQASSQAVKYITNTYGSKPHAEVRDASCLRSGCHETRVLEGKVNWVVRSERGHDVTVKFDHTPHLNQERRGKQLRCVSCHSQMVQGKHITVTQDTCFLCHFKGLKHGRDDETIGTCKGCHDAPKGQIMQVTGSFNHQEYVERGVLCENCHSDSLKGDGAVAQQVCWTCHNQPAQIARYGEPNLLHSKHVSEHKVECSSCHALIEHSLTAGARKQLKPGTHGALDSGDCGQCHEQSHLGPKEMLAGRGGRGVPEMPSPMYRAQVDCIACHQAKKHEERVADVTGQTFLATQERCDYCHGEKYKGTLEEWRKGIAKGLAQAEGALADARGAVAKRELAGATQVEVQRLLDDAGHNIRFVKHGYGAHNVTYATALLNHAVQQCEKAQAIVAERGVAVKK